MKVELKSRETVGTTSAKAARRQNLTPATVYGGTIESTSVLIATPQLDQILREQGRNAVFNVVLDGEKEAQVMFANIQRDALTSTILNVELRHIEAGQKVTVTIPVTLLEVGTIVDATVNQNLLEIEVEVAPADIPSGFEVSVEGMEIGDSKLVSELDVPEGVTVLTDGEEPIVTIAPPEAEEEETETEEEVDPAAVETTEQSNEETDDEE